MGFFFDTVLINPMLNILVVLYTILFNNFGLSIISFTIAVRLATLPLTLKQMRQMRAMSALQPKMKEIQERYAKEPQKRSQETMRLYREAGVNPLGCLGPMIIQLPIWIGLYQALLKTLGDAPDKVIGLSQRLYSWNPVGDTVVPLDSTFLWMDLANPDPSPIVPPRAGGSLHLGADEDDHDAHIGPEDGLHQQHDAVDDAPHAGVLLLKLPQRPGPLLGRVQRNWRRHPVFHHRRLESPVLQDRPSAST